MAFVRDHGTCCLILPLKLGVGIATMLGFMYSVVCILALLTSDIRFQANGYSQSLYSLPSAVGCAGMVIGFIGLLGVYDDKPLLVKVFNWWLMAVIITKVIAAVADYLMLQKCDSWLSTTEHLSAGNSQLDALAKQQVCPWARWAYILGAALDITFWCYLTARSFSYQWQVEMNPPHPIDFGREAYDKEARWKLFNVKSPIREGKTRGATDSQNDSYGSMEEGGQNQNQSQHQEPQDDDEPQDEAESYMYAPDGQRVSRRPAAGAFDSEGPSHYADGTRIGNSPGGFAAARNQSEMVPM